MKLWIDDVRPAPEGYVCCRSVNEAMQRIYYDLDCFKDITQSKRTWLPTIDIIDLDHDAGNEYKFGGDYIQILNLLEIEANTGIKIPYKFHIHSMNPVGVQNMRTIIQRNGWKEI